MQVNPHTGSIRIAAARRRANQERETILTESGWREGITVKVPSDWEGEQPTYQEVLSDEVPGGRIYLDGKPFAKAKLSARLQASDARITESRAVLNECKATMRRLGVRE